MLRLLHLFTLLQCWQLVALSNHIKHAVVRGSYRITVAASTDIMYMVLSPCFVVKWPCPRNFPFLGLPVCQHATRHNPHIHHHSSALHTNHTFVPAM